MCSRSFVYQYVLYYGDLQRTLVYTYTVPLSQSVLIFEQVKEVKLCAILCDRLSLCKYWQCDINSTLRNMPIDSMRLITHCSSRESEVARLECNSTISASVHVCNN